MDGLPGGCNPADVLFKLAHGRGIKPPIFDQVAEQGPPHAKTFSWSCSFFEGNYTSIGHGRSKKEAKNAAAKNLITQLDLSKLPQKAGKQQHYDNKRKIDTDQSDGGPPHYGKKRRGQRGAGRMGGPPHPPLGFGGFMSQDMMMGPGPGMGFPGMFGGYGARMIPPRRTLDDRLVLEKHQSICPDDTDMENILNVVDKVERSLKTISDKLVEEADTATDTTKDTIKDTTAVTDREVTGVARVGDLAKGLLLKDDSKVELVVMCSQRPGLGLLERLTSSLRSELGSAEQFEVSLEAASSGLTVSGPGCSLSITLTSPVLRTEAQADTAGPDFLSFTAGLSALAELRRAKWFSAMAAGLPSCVETIRVIKDLGRREETWSQLGDWALQLLVERSLFSAGYGLSPSKSVLRVMEVVASGLLLPDGPGIMDPCEREEMDVFSHLSPQQREDVTSAAQSEIRNIHYRKMHLTLGMEDGRSNKPTKQPSDSENLS